MHSCVRVQVGSCSVQEFEIAEMKCIGVILCFIVLVSASGFSIEELYERIFSLQALLNGGSFCHGGLCAKSCPDTNKFCYTDVQCKIDTDCVPAPPSCSSSCVPATNMLINNNISCFYYYEKWDKYFCKWKYILIKIKLLFSKNNT